MTREMSESILTDGKTAALKKMMQTRNLPKPDMRTLAFAELQLLLEKEVEELRDEIFKSVGKPMTAELLQAIQDEAGDVIAFASGIASKGILRL
jgi:NTP pyrophosphatase (non-canonical NTP hydrolase)